MRIQKTKIMRIHADADAGLAQADMSGHMNKTIFFSFIDFLL